METQAQDGGLQVGEHTPLTHTEDQCHDVFESLDYDEVASVLHTREQRFWTKRDFRKRAIVKWVVTLVIGCSVGVTAYLIDLGTAILSDIKFDTTAAVMSEWGAYGWAGATYIAISCALVSVAAFLVVFVERVAAGSGIPEIKCYLNGVKIPHVVRLRTLLCKATGVLFSVAGGLAVGKEGPMIHSGAAIAAGLCQGKSTSIPFINPAILKHFRNDQAKRDFVSAGAAAGVAAAFGAPVGGVLFSLEEGASFWNQELTWRTLFCTMVSTFTLNFLLSGTNGQWGTLAEPGLVTFGDFDNQVDPGYTVLQIPLFLAMGVLGGLAGAMFNVLNKQITLFRTRFYRAKWYYLLAEVLVIAIITATVSFVFSNHFYSCQPLSQDDEDLLSGFQHGCPDGQFNDMAALFYTSAETAIKNLLHATSPFSGKSLVLFSVTYWFIACVTYGIAVPSGLFVPSLVIGCAYGRGFGQWSAGWMPARAGVDPGTFALIGAASMLGGIVRMTISLTVILMESTNDVTYGLPIMLTLMVAKWVGDVFNEGLYDIHIHLRKIPLLEWEPPETMRKFAARNVMNTPVVTLPPNPAVRVVVQVLEQTEHNGFPVVDHKHRFMGLILRSQLITLLQKKDFRETDRMEKSFYLATTEDDFQRNYPRCGTIFKDVELEAHEYSMYLDLLPYMNPVPFSVNDTAPLPRVFRLFRTMGVRHLTVVDKNNKVVGMITRENLTHLEERASEINKGYNVMNDEGLPEESDWEGAELASPSSSDLLRIQPTSFG